MKFYFVLRVFLASQLRSSWLPVQHTVSIAECQTLAPLFENLFPVETFKLASTTPRSVANMLVLLIPLLLTGKIFTHFYVIYK